MKGKRKEVFRPGKKTIAHILENIRKNKNDPQLGWPGCDKFFPPKD